MNEPGVGLFVPELYRLQGLCLLRLDSNNESDAIKSLATAVDVAKQQKATFFELKAAIDLAKAAGASGQQERGLQPLRDVCTNLPEGFDAPQFAEAKRLLA